MCSVLNLHRTKPDGVVRRLFTRGSCTTKDGSRKHQSHWDALILPLAKKKQKKTGHCWRVETERFTLRHCSRCSDRLSSTAIKTVRWRWIWWRPVCSDSQRWLLEAVKDCTWRFPSQVSLLFQLWNQCFRCSAVCFHHASVWTSYSAEFPGPPSNCFLSFTVEYQ